MTQAERLKLPLDERYIGVTFEGSRFPDAPYKIYPVKFTGAIQSIYIPTRDIVMKDYPMGFKILCLAQALKEGYYSYLNSKGKRVISRSFKTNNPGNIGNTDNGKNQSFAKLEDGIMAQVNYINLVASGKHKRYPLGKDVHIEPFYSEEIDNHPEYGLPCNLPGYKFKYTGQIDQYVKLYATGPRAGNGYIDNVVSVYHHFGYTSVTPESKIQDIIKLV